MNHFEKISQKQTSECNSPNKDKTMKTLNHLQCEFKAKILCLLICPSNVSKCRQYLKTEH